MKTNYSTKEVNNHKIELRSVVINAGTPTERTEYFYVWGKFISQAWNKPSYRNIAAKKHEARGLSSFLRG